MAYEESKGREQMQEKQIKREQEILAGLRSREEEAIRWLLEDYGALMKSVICHHLRGFPQEEKEECLNQVLFEIWEGHDSFRPHRGSFEAWIASICKYRAVNLMKKLWKTREEMPIEEEKLCLPASMPFGDGTSELLEDMLSGLKDKEQVLVREYYLEGFTVREIAERYQMKPLTVYKRIERSIKKMRKGLGR